MADKDISRERPVIPEFEQANAMERLRIASQRNPAIPVGLSFGGVGLIYMLSQARKTKQKLSVHLIHTRMLVQGTIVTFFFGVAMQQFYNQLQSQSKKSGE